MLKFGSLKKKLSNVKIVKRKSDKIEAHLAEEQGSKEENGVFNSQPFTYKDILFGLRVSCLFEEEVDEVETLKFMRNVFEISENESETMLEEVNDKLRIYKYENIVEHSLLMVETLKYDLDNSKTGRFLTLDALRPQTTKIINSHAKYKHLNQTEIAFAKWTALNEISCFYSFHPSVFEETFDSLTAVDEKTQTLRLKTETYGLIEDFWKSSEKFSKSCLNFLEALPAAEKSEAIENENILLRFFKTINKLQKCNPPVADFSLNKNFQELVNESTSNGVNKYLLAAYKQTTEDFNAEKQLLKIVRIVDKASESYQSLLEQHESSFKM